ncbi:MAG: DUF3320 domain-containing protein [Deltaproteobacteria bacterium]|nr:DUF3320 domain-containing protein [Deltaproteobacteria bacterium]
MMAIRAQLGDKVSLAQQQNDFPLLHELVIQNDGPEPLNELSMEISADPAFLTSRKWLFDRLAPGEEKRVSDLDVTLSRQYLAGLGESVRASVTIEAKAGRQTVGVWERPVLVLAPEEWGGLSHLPDLTAAFCLPNDRVVEKVLKRAAQALTSSGKGSVLNGYQSKDRKQVWRQVSAIYSAVCSLGLDYASPPASFEQEGQRIRSPKRVVESGLGTCLDLALFMAACLEQGGLNPLLVLVRGHAFVGCWLVETDFSSTVIDDCQSVRKRQQLGEMVLVEATAVTSHPAPAFSQAVEQGSRHLEDDERFVCALDISRARMNHIRPLIDREEPRPTDSQPQATGEHAPPAVEDAPDLPDIDYLPEGKEPAPDTPDSRVEQWKRKLLDLTLRNRLLNFNPNKKSVPVFCPNPARLEDLLADGRKLKFAPLPEIMEGRDPRSKDLHQARHGTDAKKEFAQRALDKLELLVDLTSKEMDDRLVDLYRLARREMEEGGSNTLFLALGFLNWTQAASSSRVLRAPLILLPVQLERTSVRAGFKLLLHDDDPCLNPTLLEMLRKDFQLSMPNLENELPKDESGLDVPLIWHTVRQYVRDMKGWEVTEEVYLGTFSFTKYLMWKDLQDRLGQLKQNPVVRHLIESPREHYRGEGEFPECRKLDDEYPPEKVFCPLSADSSQLSAVLAAAQGKDFVVVGPPGTGKSQTITNMIVQCLVEGKTVLFVSEKMAALDVVYRRLRDVGVGTYCLEMHSSKARKLDVLRQLEAAWNSREAFDDREWQNSATQIAELRTRLNQYPRQLHKLYPNGYTPHQALGVLIAHEDQPRVSFSWSGPTAHDQDAMIRLKDVAERLGVNAKEAGGLARHPLRGVWQEEWSPGWQEDLLNKARDLSAGVKALTATLAGWLASLGLEVPVGNRERITALCDLAELLPRAAGKSWAFAFSSQARDCGQQLARIAACGRTIEQLRGELSLEYKADTISLDLDELENQWKLAEEAWWLKSFFGRRAVAKRLRACTPEGKPPEQADIPGDLATLQKIKAEEQAIVGMAEAGKLLGPVWQGLQTDWSELEEAVEFAGQASSILGRLSGADLDLRAALRGRLERVLREGNDLLAEGGVVRRQGDEALRAFDDFGNKLVEAWRSASASGEDALADPSSDQWLQSLEAAMEGWLANSSKLHTWCGWRRVRQQAMVLGLEPLVAALERGEITPEGVETAFEVSYCHWWLGRVMDGDKVLKSFHSAEHERYIDKFRHQDEHILRITSQFAKAHISGNIPSQQESGNKGRTEWGVLKREMTKKRGHMPLRKLAESVPNVLTKLTPCLLMSPLSVAQYLSPDTALFDVVIFDEASQIPVWDAIGALARGRQAIVVGDPKQLPPTSFFSRGDDEEELQEWEVEDLESILDECQGANLPSQSLRWHYRSRHESLIVFSNLQYYRGELITFPSAITQDKAVEYFHVPEGVYEKGKGRVNREEARAVVAAALGWLRNPEFVRERWSLGVVTFNQQQQMLIEDLLDEARRDDPDLEIHFGTERIEPVFVKNLENVQGDERDIILFSVTYGPDDAGKVSMNFGPLNKQGGERRLNVAITRARRALQVFGTLKAEHIDLSRTKNQGVRDFKHFLEFAELGPRALAQMADPTHGDFESVFEQEVAEELQKHGWSVHPQVGVSGFRVDLGVVHPDFPGRYLAGVECDGATYHRSATARDRDRLRESVLRGLGWSIVRVWSTDWWVDRANSAEKLDKRLKETLAADQREQERKQRERQAQTEAKPPEPKEPTLEEKPATRPDLPPAHLAQAQQPLQGKLYAASPVSVEAAPLSPDNRQEVYRIVDFGAAILAKGEHQKLQPDDFYQNSHDAKIKAMIEAMVAKEGPVALRLVVERVARAYGLKRIGNAIDQRVRTLARRVKCERSNDNGQVYLWPYGCSPTEWTGFRINPDGQKPLRPVEMICSRELKNLADYVQEVDCPLDEKGLLKGVAERLGFKMLTQRLENELRSSILK